MIRRSPIRKKRLKARRQHDGDWFVAYEGETEFQHGMVTISDMEANDWEVVSE